MFTNIQNYVHTTHNVLLDIMRSDDHMDTIGSPYGIYGKEEPYDLEFNDRVHQCIAGAVRKAIDGA
jgi:hypothetical protein